MKKYEILDKIAKINELIDETDTVVKEEKEND